MVPMCSTTKSFTAHVISVAVAVMHVSCETLLNFQYFVQLVLNDSVLIKMNEIRDLRNVEWYQMFQAS